MTDDFDDFLKKHGFIDGIFDNITPEEFHVETTAVGICDLAALDSQYVGPGAFDRFVARHLETVRVSYAISEGQTNVTVVVLATRDTQYVFIPDHDENLGQFMERLRREAASLRAGWTFIARKCVIGPANEDEDEDSILGDEDVFNRAATRGRMRVGVLFYTQRKDEDGTECRQGYMHDDGESNLGEVHMAIATQRTPLFNILG